MRWPLPRLLAALALLWACTGTLAAGSGDAGIIALRDAAGTIEAAGRVRVWLDPGGDATVEQVTRAAAATAFQPAVPDHIHRLPGPCACIAAWTSGRTGC